MYEHPSLTITAMLEEQQMLNRAVERRRAILERLETQGVPRPSWLDRVRAAARGGSPRAAARSTTAAADSRTAATITDAAEPAGRTRLLPLGAARVPEDAMPADSALADADILVLPVR
ncbi:hypothetical protein M2317_003188 [Microbacterium sp. ZKA21]|uniref:hypothetical protein n=1 Tax=Microbacterium sp. ZKA21 TaxID=3381694 RepID=UPI003D192003